VIVLTDSPLAGCVERLSPLDKPSELSTVQIDATPCLLKGSSDTVGLRIPEQNQPDFRLRPSYSGKREVVNAFKAAKRAERIRRFGFDGPGRRPAKV